MWSKANSVIRRRLPTLHGFAKRIFLAKMTGGHLLPIPKRMHGATYWLHPAYITADLDKIEPHVQGWISDYLGPGGVFFDVGAFHGLHSLLAARIVGGHGRVVTFEPSPRNLAILEYHKRINRLGQITVVPRAVSNACSANSSFWVVNDGNSQCNSLTIGSPDVPFCAGTRTETSVSTTTIDRYCDEMHLYPDFLKIDVEGAELMVLEGARETLERAKPVVVLAIHPFWLPAGQSTMQIVDYFTSVTYEIESRFRMPPQSLIYGEYLCRHRDATGR